ncbi:MAG: hypothetical protein ACOYL8_02960 [Patescibacteria group bacterium]
MQKERANYREIQKSAFAEVLRFDFIEPDYSQEISLPEAVSQLSGAIAKHIYSSKQIRKYIEDLKKGMGNDCPDSPIDEIIKYLADQTGQIDKSDPSLNLRFLDSLMFPIFDLERECFFRLFVSNKNATEFEANLFDYSIELGKLIDELYYEWFKAIVVDYQRLKPSEKENYERTLKSSLSQFDYTSYNYIARENKLFNRYTWALSFPNLIKEIVDTIEELTDSCVEFGERELHDYFSALSKAYACQEINKLESAWAKVDEAWIKIPNNCRMFPIHGMENGYEHPYGISPEYKLVVRTSYGQEMISKIRNHTSVYALKIEIENSLVELAEKKLTNLDMGVFTSAMRSGVCANFRSAGQVVPNRQAILANGGKVFMDIDTAQNSVHRDMNLLIENCTSEMGNKLSSLITVDHSLAHTIAHECMHPIGCTPKSDEALGDAKFRLEEAKATLGGLAAILDDMPIEKWPEVVALSIARVCRFFKKATYENPTVAAYVRENLVMANLLIGSRVVSIDSPDATSLSVNLSISSLRMWQALLKEFYKDVIYSYHSEESALNISQLEKLYSPTNYAIENWIALVNKH